MTSARIANPNRGYAINQPNPALQDNPAGTFTVKECPAVVTVAGLSQGETVVLQQLADPGDPRCNIDPRWEPVTAPCTQVFDDDNRQLVVMLPGTYRFDISGSTSGELCIQWVEDCTPGRYFFNQEQVCDDGEPQGVILEGVNIDCTTPVPVLICVQNLEFEFACASGGAGEQGRLIIVEVDNNTQPPTITLRELDGTEINDGTTPVSCTFSTFSSEACYQLIADPTQTYARILIFDVTDLTVPIGVVWVDNVTSTVVAAPNPADIELCAQCCPIFYQQTLCDIQGDGSSIPFIRRFTRQSDGVYLVESFDLAGNAYVQTGTDGVCQPNKRWVQVLCDPGAGDLSFQRCYEADNLGAITFIDLDFGGQLYTPVGVPELCTVDVTLPVSDTSVCLCDDGTDPPTPYILVISNDGEGNRTFDTFNLDGSAYALVGNPVKCETVDIDVITPACFQWDDNGTVRRVTAYARLDDNSNFASWVVLSGTPPPDLTLADALEACTLVADTEHHILCDDNGPFMRHYVYAPDGQTVVNTFTTDLNGAAYVPLGAEVPCNQTEVVDPDCYEWVNDNDIVNFVTGYVRLDREGNFIEWVVLEGDPPPDLTDPTALRACQSVVRVADMCCRGELTDDLLETVGGGGALAFRLKARQEPNTMFQDIAGTVSANSQGDPIARVNDASGQGQDFIQLVAGNRPDYNFVDSAFARVEHSGGTDHLEANLTNIPGGPGSHLPFTVAYVFEPAPGAAHGAAFLSVDDNSNLVTGSWQISRGSGAAVNDLVFRFDAGSLVDIPIPFPGGWPAFESSGKHLVTLFYDGAQNIQVFVDGVEYLNAPTSVPVRAFETWRVFGNRADNSYPNGFFDELLVWFGALNAAQVQTINEYAVCFHELEPPLGTIFTGLPDGSVDYPTAYVKYETGAGGVRFLNTDTGVVIEVAQGEVPIPGLAECPGGGGSSELTTTVNVFPTDIIANGPGNTTLSLAQLSVSNVGAAAATWNGASLPPGASITYTAYFDPVTNVYNRIGPIAYDATGTMLLISETP